MPFKFNPFSGQLDSVQDISDLTTGPASSTDNALVRFDSTTGKLMQNSLLLGQDDGRLTLGADGTASLDAVTKQQLDAAIQGVVVKEGAAAASTGNLTLSGEQTVDNIALVTGDRVLVKNQTDNTENGIYTVDTGAWTRTADANAASELNGAFVSVAQGDVNANTGWYQFEEITTLGSDNVNFNQFFGAGSYTADGNGIELSGSTFSLELDGSTLSKSATGLKIADGGITNSQVNASAAIDYSKLNLSGSILNADINVSAAIEYSKLNLNNSISNSDISTSAAIQFSKMENLTTFRALISSATGDVSVANTTSTELNFLSGVTSNVQNQLNSKFAFNETSLNSSITATNRITYICNTSSGPITITLPPANGNDFVVVKDAAASSETNPITIDADGTELIDGQQTYVIESNYETVILISDGIEWHIM